MVCSNDHTPPTKPRARRLLKALMRGQAIKEAAAAEGISPRVARDDLAAMQRTLRAGNHVHLALLAIALHVVTQPPFLMR